MSDTRVTGWVGWGVFASLILITAGVFDAVYGLAALIGPDSAYFLGSEGNLFLLDIQGWGWLHLLWGVAFIVVGFSLLTGATWARVVAVILAISNGVLQLALLPVQPWWSLIVITLDILVIYALTVHGRELKEAYGR